MQLRVDCELPEIESCNRCSGKNGDDAKRLDPWRTQTSAPVALWQSRRVAGKSEFGAKQTALNRLFNFY
jgi:hypothetical protein